jgi:hypothetical protein
VRGRGRVSARPGLVLGEGECLAAERGCALSYASQRLGVGGGRPQRAHAARGVVEAWLHASRIHGPGPRTSKAVDDVRRRWQLASIRLLCAPGLVATFGQPATVRYAAALERVERKPNAWRASLVAATIQRVEYEAAVVGASVPKLVVQGERQAVCRAPRFSSAGRLRGRPLVHEQQGKHGPRPEAKLFLGTLSADRSRPRLGVLECSIPHS